MFCPPFNKICLFLFVIVFTIACNKEIKSPNWDVDITTPLIKSTFTIDDLQLDSQLTVLPDNSLVLNFEQSVFKLDKDTLFNIPDTTVTNSFSIPSGTIFLNPGQQFVNIEEETRFSVQEARLLEAEMREGIIEVTLESTINQATIFEYNLPTAFKNGQPFVFTKTLAPGSQSNPTVQTLTLDIKDYKINLSGKDGSDFNTLYSLIKVSIHPNASATSINNQDKVSISSTFKEITPQFARGFFGQYEHQSSLETTKLNGSPFLGNGVLKIEDIDIELSIENGIGVDIQLFLEQLNAVNTTNNAVTTLQNNTLNSSINLNRAENKVWYAKPSKKTIILNKSNSNIIPFIETVPNALSYAYKLNINPLGNVGQGNDFFYYDSDIEVKLKLEFPLCFLANNLILQDTFDVKFDDKKLENINYGSFTLFAENTFPLGAVFTLITFDETLTRFDTIVSTNDILPSLDETATISEVHFNVTGTHLAHLLDSRKILIQATFNTPANAGNIKIKNTQYLTFKLTGNFNNHINLSN